MKIEKETIINFNEEEKVATIYTCKKSWFCMMISYIHGN